MKQTLVLTATSVDINSVQSINDQLIDCYRQLDGCRIFVVEDCRAKLPLELNYNNFFRSLLQNTPAKIVITHPVIFRSHFFLMLLTYLQKADIEYIFHLYGDFIRQTKKWMILSPYLTGKKIKFVAPSSPYKAIVDNFIENRNCFELPFSVDEKKFKYDPSSRNEIRKKLGFTSDDIVFCYSGRFSQQKNLESVIDFLKNEKESLLLIGHEDDFQVSTVGKSETLNSQFVKINTKINTSKHVLVDHTNKEKLNSLYNASDIFVSFSHYHDEDFGCAPVEALMSGLPALLTDWGGYKDILKRSKEFTKAVKLNLRKDHYEFEINDEWRDLLSIDRKKCSEFYTAIYSGNEIKTRLQSILNEEVKSFKGFSSLLTSVASENYFITHDGELNTESYLKVYGVFGANP